MIYIRYRFYHIRLITNNLRMSQERGNWGRNDEHLTVRLFLWQFVEIRQDLLAGGT